MLLDQSEDVLTTRIAAHSVGLLSIAESPSSEEVPVPFRIRGTDLLCLVPRWTSLAAAFDQQAERNVVLAVAESRTDGEYWLYCHGVALETTAQWPGFQPTATKGANVRDRYSLIRISPQHLETVYSHPNRRESATPAMLA